MIEISKLQSLIRALISWNSTIFNCLNFKFFQTSAWREDGRCGEQFPLTNGYKSQCSPSSPDHCCSSNGWCGRTDAHCKCSSCIDYSLDAQGTQHMHRLVRLKFAAFFSLLLGGGWLVHLAWKKVKAYI